MDLLFLDTETTDLDANARLVQLAYRDSKTDVFVNEYFKPPVPISYGSMAVHHITEKMVADKPAFNGSETQRALIALLADRIFVAHNASFDMRILKNEGVNIDRCIDTLRVAKHLVPSEQYKLQYLRYFLNLDTDGIPHDAKGDVMVLESLFGYLRALVRSKFKLANDDDQMKKMLELTQTPVLLQNFTFGKYNNKSFQDVRAIDPGYLEWLYASESKKNTSEQSEDLVYTLKHYLAA